MRSVGRRTLTRAYMHVLQMNASCIKIPSIEEVRWDFLMPCDLDAELKISGGPPPIQKQFNERLSVNEVQSVLASFVLR